MKMLKVVGASDIQTIASISILVGILVFGILIVILCDHENNEDNQKYSATINWNPYTDNFDINLWGQNNDPQTVSLGVARAYFQSNMEETGWAILEVESNAQYADRFQAYAAGILEGILSWKHIYWHWKNTVEFTCRERETFCSLIRKFLQNNTNIIRNKAAENYRIDPFWHQVHLFYRQLDGIEYGFKYEVIRNQESYEIPSLDFLWMNFISDLKDFEKAFQSSANNSYSSPAAISFLKLVSNKPGKFFLAHASSGFYSSMLRIQKKYKLNYHTFPKLSTPVPGHTIAFTSYPASIHSQDDFYQILMTDENVITVTGASFDIDVTENEIKHSFDQPMVLLGPRVMAANRLANDGKAWTNIFSSYNSGTGNKQWWHLQSASTNIYFWVLEQTPQIIISKNETNKLLKKRYWISCGTSYYQTKTLHDKNIANEVNNKICKVLIHGQKDVTNIRSLLKLMKEPELAMACRTDLHFNSDFPFQPNYSKYNHLSVKAYSSASKNQDTYFTDIPVTMKYLNMNKNSESFILNYNKTWNGLYSVKNIISLIQSAKKQRVSAGRTSRCNSSETVPVFPVINGIIDLKVTESSRGFLAIAGPPFNLENKEKPIKPFQWSTSKINYLPHNGHLDIWNFQPFAAQFVWD